MNLELSDPRVVQIVAVIEDFKHKSGLDKKIARVKKCDIEVVRRREDRKIARFTIEYILAIETQSKRDWIFTELTRFGVIEP